MPTRSDILDTLAASQEKVTAYFQGLNPEELEQFTDEQLASPAPPTLVADRNAGELFAANAQHAAVHMTWIEEGFRQGL